MTAFIKCQLLLIDMSFFSATQWKQVNRSQAKKAQPSLSFLFAAKIKTICFSDQKYFGFYANRPSSKK